jgi:ribosomal protein S18 acetylase RimI-like enzyme
VDEARLTLRTVPAGGRRPYVELLREAEDSTSEIESYLDSGDLFLFTLLQTGGETVIGHVLVRPLGQDEQELKNLAIVEGHRRLGFGRSMIGAVLAELRARGVRRVEVATSGADTGNLEFYQRCGFRLLRIERDYFSPARGYPEGFSLFGLPASDLVVLDQTFG